MDYQSNLTYLDKRARLPRQWISNINSNNVVELNINRMHVHMLVWCDSEKRVKY